MRKLLLVILLSVLGGLAVFGCSDKSTEPDDDWQRVNLTLYVRRSDNMPVIEARVELRPCPLTLSRYDCMDQNSGFIFIAETDYAGRFELFPERKDKSDTMSVYVSKLGYHPDSLEFVLTYEQQDVDIYMVLYEDTLNPPPEPEKFVIILVWVSDIGRNPISGATVKMWHERTLHPHYRSTNSGGVCHFWPDVSPPHDTIWFSAEMNGYTTDTSYIVIDSAGQVLDHYITLNPEMEE